MPIWTAYAGLSGGREAEPAVIRWTAVPFILRRGACAAHLVLIAGLSLLPAGLFPLAATRIPGMDKVIHVALYGVLGGLLRWAADEREAWAAGWALPLAGAAYGLLMEGAQLWLSGGARSFSWGDALANLLGVVLFWCGTGRLLGRRSPAGS